MRTSQPVARAALLALCLAQAAAFSVPHLGGVRLANRASPLLRTSPRESVRVSAGRGQARVGPFMLMDEAGKIVDKGLDNLFGTKTIKRAAGQAPTGGGGEQPVVIVLDDDFNSFIDVVKAFREVLGCSWKEAFALTQQVGTTGAAEVFRGSAEECERIKDELVARPQKLDANVGSAGGEKQMGEARQAKRDGAKAERALRDAVWGTRTFKNGARPRVTVVGGTGRVGAWTIRELFRMSKGEIDFVIAGRNEASATRLMQQLAGEAFVTGGREWATMQIKQQGTTSFAEVSLGDKGSMERAMAGSDLVIHTAGPFQGGKPQVLEAAIAAGVAYMDVCDDVEYCQEMKTKSEAARAAGIPAVTTCGIYPGLSNVMAAALVRQVAHPSLHAPSS
ncbi:Saccharopine dehydrogenase-domain-containing protein [Baffinella frigidus]|nr:Saccharopine dehydrogenase-domain-containing protein [Cryptophyta sp. CCMP2293]